MPWNELNEKKEHTKSSGDEVGAVHRGKFEPLHVYIKKKWNHKLIT